VRTVKDLTKSELLRVEADILDLDHIVSNSYIQDGGAIERMAYAVDYLKEVFEME